MKNYWKTKTGDYVEISKMETSHIENSIKMIERKAKDGLTGVFNMGYAPDNDYVEYEEFVMYGKEVIKHFEPAYSDLKKELTKRLTASNG